ncbi:uncharacterized protein RHOBADRAFT_48876, partial [Rhodotorula graminis WP1]
MSTLSTLSSPLAAAAIAYASSTAPRLDPGHLSPSSLSRRLPLLPTLRLVLAPPPRSSPPRRPSRQAAATFPPPAAVPPSLPHPDLVSPLPFSPCLARPSRFSFSPLCASARALCTFPSSCASCTAHSVVRA